MLEYYDSFPASFEIDSLDTVPEGRVENPSGLVRAVCDSNYAYLSIRKALGHSEKSDDPPLGTVPWQDNQPPP